MKLASLKGDRDGRLVVVSRDLAWCVDASPIVATLQEALDDWDVYAPQLRGLADSLEHGGVPRERFHEHEAASPLPRAYRWAIGAAGDPAIRQGRSDAFLGPREPIRLEHAAGEGDLRAGAAVITGDVASGSGLDVALGQVRLVLLVTDVAPRGEAGCDPAMAAFSPVAVTPDELDGWRDGELHGAVEVEVNGEPVDRAPGGPGAAFDFPALIVQAAKGRGLHAGAILGLGASCLAQPPNGAASAQGAPTTQFLRAGDRVRIEMRDGARHSIFGAIEQEVAGP